MHSPQTLRDNAFVIRVNRMKRGLELELEISYRETTAALEELASTATELENSRGYYEERRQELDRQLLVDAHDVNDGLRSDRSRLEDELKESARDASRYYEDRDAAREELRLSSSALEEAAAAIDDASEREIETCLELDTAKEDLRELEGSIADTIATVQEQLLAAVDELMRLDA